MAGQVSPGVVIKERDLTNARIDNTIDNVGAIAGPFERGPVNEMTNIVDEKSSSTLLVLPTLTTQNSGLPLLTSWHTVVNFKVVRVGASTLVNAVSDSATAL